MKVLIACEYSGIVRDAFIEAGHDAISCDLLPTERPGPHYQGDVRELLREPWDLVIAHPPCTYLCNSGMPENAKHPERILKAIPALDFFIECYRANAPRVAVENSMPAPYTKGFLGKPDFVASQKHFGGPGTKRACWWVRNIPPLMATLTDPNARDLVTGSHNSKSRSRAASRFHPGMAAAMARQWGSL